jgi:putative aldouronate transport system permease protein
MKKNRTTGDISFNTINYTVFTVITLMCIFPFYYIFINTISNNNLVMTGQISLLPRQIHFYNYINALKLKTIPQGAFISFSRTIVGTSFVVMCASFMGYAFSRQEYWGRKFWYKVVVATMYFNAGIIPAFLLIKELGLYNSFWVYILPGVVSPFNIILCKTYIESLPDSLEESAEIDGAGYLIRYTKIIIPLAKPILATIAIFSAVGHWNSFIDTLLYIVDTKLFTLQFVLYQYLQQANAIQEILKDDPTAFAGRDITTMLSPLTVRYTISIITIFPVLLVYPFFQKYFIKGIMIGAIKG